MYITAYFTNNGIPAIGLSPILNVYDMDGNNPVKDQTMIEVVNGFYKYDFSSYDDTKDYLFLAIDSTLPPNEQRVVASSESMNNSNRIGRILGLSHSNFKLSNQFYDEDGNLLSASITIYKNAEDMAYEIVMNTYSIVCEYTNGVLTSYKSTEVV